MSTTVEQQSEHYREQGNVCYREGRYRQAEALYSQAHKKHPTAKVLTNRSLTRLQLKDAHGALKDAQKAAQLDERSAKACFLQARALHMLGRIQSAVAMAKLAHELAPSDATIIQFLTQRQLDTTGAAPQNLVALCASHIECHRRLECLHLMIASVAKQTKPVPFYLSISCSQQFSREVQQLDSQYPHVQFLKQPRKLSQGQHYKCLANLIVSKFDSDNTWVFFTDDDDLWHPDRASHYHALAELSGPLSRHQVMANQCCQLVDNKIQPGQVCSAEDVDKKLLYGKWKTSQTVGSEPNYWSYSCRLVTFHQFVSQCQEAVLNHTFWDVCFSKFLVSCSRYNIRTDQVADCWMYLWRNDPQMDHVTQHPICSTGLADVRHNLALYCAYTPLELHSRTRFNAVLHEQLKLGAMGPDELAAFKKHAFKMLKDAEFQALLHSPALD